MKYIRIFETHQDYQNYRQQADFLTPNLSLCEDSNEVHFNKYIPPYDPYNGHEYVDLGLPSGTLWAKCNVGAETETDYGLYFAWGETQGYTAEQVNVDRTFNTASYAFGPYDYSDKVNNGITKYNNTDGLTTLELSDDAAHVNMGGEWHMPTIEQINELLDTTYVTPQLVNNYKGSNVNGCLFTSVLNGNTLFIPYSGGCQHGTIISVGSGTWLWSLKTVPNNVGYMLSAKCLEGTTQTPPNLARLSGTNRYNGSKVRGVVG